MKTISEARARGRKVVWFEGPEALVDGKWVPLTCEKCGNDNSRCSNCEHRFPRA